MNMDKYIVELLGMDSYTKGRRYYAWYVDKNDEGKTDDGYYYKFSVESERTYRHYKVEFKNLLFFKRLRRFGFFCGIFIN